ncbi:unnamed protein product [Amoebophrya sp. A120]|nr:unnamed protein product [Amoebophrya sp. A120]|eukprot:GSA120T00005660001.1
MEDCTTGASAEKDAKQGEAEKYKYVVYLADIYEAEERSTSDNEEEENSDRSEYRAGHGYTEVPENDVSVMKIDSDDCGTLAFWAAIDSHCDDLKEEMRQKCAYHDEEAHDVCDVEDNRSYWMSNVIAKGHSYNKSKIFGESSEVSKDEWDRGVPKGATLLFKIRADWTYLDWEWDCDEEPLRRQQNAVWVKRMKITEDENVYEKI